jgi:undecaprenyl-diphosphatase
LQVEGFTAKPLRTQGRQKRTDLSCLEKSNVQIITSMQSLDAQFLLFINHNTANDLFDVLMPALTYHGYLLVVPFLFYIFIIGVMRKDTIRRQHLIEAIAVVLIACCSVYLAGWVEDWMKDFVARARPCRTIEGIRLILPCPKSYSMPSGHAIGSFAFAAPLFYLTREHISVAWRLFPVVLAAMIAFSRIYLGVHYPTDVLAGALMGAVIGLVLSILYLIASKEFMIRIRR